MTARWTLVDLVLVVLGWMGGALVAGLAAGLVTSDLSIINLASLVGQFIGSVGVIALIGRMRGLGFESLGFDLRPADLLYLAVGVGLQILIALVFAPIQERLLPEGGPSQQLTELFMEVDTTSAQILMVATATLLAPLSEELMFRGVLLRALIHRSRALVLWVTAVVFALFHLIGVTSVEAGVIVFFQILIMGLVLGAVTLRHNRLGPAVFIHGGFNMLATLVLLLPPEVLEQLEQAAGTIWPGF